MIQQSVAYGSLISIRRMRVQIYCSNVQPGISQTTCSFHADFKCSTVVAPYWVSDKIIYTDMLTSCHICVITCLFTTAIFK